MGAGQNGNGARQHYRSRGTARVLPVVSWRARVAALTLVAGAGAAMLGMGLRGAQAIDPYTNEWLEDEGTGSVDPVYGGVDSDYAEDQPGPDQCQGSVGNPGGLDPGWVRVNVNNKGQQLYADNGDPSTPVVKAEGQILDPSHASSPLPPDIVPSRKTNAWVNFTDNTFNHWSRDFNIFLTLDKKYRHLLASPGQFIEGSANELGNLEVEWERGTIPQYAMPAVGDRLTVWGAHTWDCGHGDTWAEFTYPYPVKDTYRSEIHPPVGWVTYRRTADIDGHPNAGKDTQDPWTWFGPGDGNGIATTLPNTALKDTPVHATVADSYFSSYGGNTIESLNGCDYLTSEVKCWDKEDRPELHLDDSWEWQQRVLDNDYEFFLPLPDKPANAPAWATPVWGVEERCGEIPPDPTFPDKDHIEADSDGGVEGYGGLPGQYYWADKGIGAATCNPSPDGQKPYSVTPTSENGRQGYLVAVRAKTGHDGVDGTADDPAYPGNDYVAFAYRFKAAWDVTQPQPATTVKVQFDDLRVYNDADGCGEDGEWVMTLRTNESTIYPVHGEANPDEEDNDSDTALEPFWEDGAIDDGLCDGGDDNEFQLHNLGYGHDTIDRTVSLAPSQKVEIWERTYDKDILNDETFDPVIEFVDPPPVGETESNWYGYVNENTAGSHTILVHRSNVTPHSIDPGELHHTQPKYGPDPFDTGFDTLRVSGFTSPSVVLDEPADGVEYRMWKDGDPVPTSWTTVPATDQQSISLDHPYAGRPSGTYRLEWAALNDSPLGTIVGERSFAHIQIDNDPPVLTVPADIDVPATETAGTHVEFTVTAHDNFHPQPVLDSPTNPYLSCDHKSGDLFLQGLNEAKTTLVTCTATDAVGNTTVGNFKVTVRSPFGYVNDFVVLATDSYADVGRESTVVGNVGVYDSGDGGPWGPSGQPGAEVATGKSVVLDGKTAAESVILGSDTKAQGVWWVDFIHAATGATYSSNAGYVPLWPCPPKFPTFPVIPGSGNNLTFGSNSTLMPGKWGELLIKPNVTVYAFGGDYQFASIRLMPGAHLEVRNPARFFVTGSVEISNLGYVGPQRGVPSPLSPTDVKMYVAGGSGSAKDPSLLARNEVQLQLNVHTAGALVVGNEAKAVGAFVGRSVEFGSRASIRRASAFKADQC